ncbi:hypothetical protein ACSNOK_08160 [Streptomyces sp. URMC 126]|uniref:hypothetical protein n=1 Tax=Streptomyces sp. URMC 126 TaxID=3423401 RepID=UPI003F1CE0B2
MQRFVLGDGRAAAGFESELARQARVWDRLRGLEGQVVLRALDRTGSYLHLAFWRSPEDLFGALHTDAACARLDRLGRLAAIEPAQAVPVGLLGDGPTTDKAEHALLVRGTLAGPGPTSRRGSARWRASSCTTPGAKAACCCGTPSIPAPTSA